MPKKNLQILALDRKFKITQNDINKTFDFDQTPKLLETFDQVIQSSEIRSSDHFPFSYCINFK